jgi:hypothetical protein
MAIREPGAGFSLPELEQISHLSEKGTASLPCPFVSRFAPVAWPFASPWFTDGSGRGIHWTR